MIKTNIILRSSFGTISRWKFLDGPRRRRKSLAWLSTLIFLYGCASSEMQLGRQSLFNNKPNEALTRFQRVAEMDPNYVNRYYQEGVWTYVGRAQYLTGKFSEARHSLEKAVAQHNDDYFARLYLGLTLARSGDPSSGLTQIESGIKGIHQANEFMREHSNFELWDQTKQIRKDTESILAMISGKDFDWANLISNCESVGRKFEEELDLAMEDEQIDNSPRW